MSGIDAIGSSSTWAAVTGVQSTHKKKNDTADAFSKILENLRSGAPAGGTSSDNDDKTVTTTTIMSDGSVLITVTKGDQIISQQKTHGSNQNGQQPATLLDKQSDELNATSSSLTGTLFSAKT
ncbi:MAG: hypothetical protein WCS30_04390 [Selenomonadaceae bacterium]